MTNDWIISLLFYGMALCLIWFSAKVGYELRARFDTRQSECRHRRTKYYDVDIKKNTIKVVR